MTRRRRRPFKATNSRTARRFSTKPSLSDSTAKTSTYVIAGASVLSALATISIAGMAYYAAFHSPLKDAFQAELKFEVLEAKSELETTENRFKEIQNEARRLNDENKIVEKTLDERENALQALQKEIKIREETLKTKERELKLATRNLYESKNQIADLKSGLRLESENQAFQKLDTVLLRKGSQIINQLWPWAGEPKTFESRELLMGLKFVQKSEGDERFMRVYRQLDLTPHMPASSRDTWANIETAIQETEITTLEGYALEQYYKLKNHFINNCREKFTSHKFVFSRSQPTFEDEPKWMFYPSNSSKAKTKQEHELDNKIQSENNQKYVRIHEENADKAEQFTQVFNDALEQYLDGLNRQVVECLSSIKNDHMEFYRGKPYF